VPGPARHGYGTANDARRFTRPGRTGVASARVLCVLPASPDGESAGIAAETVVLGDPRWTGPFAGV